MSDGAVFLQVGGTGSGKTTNTKNLIQNFRGKKQYFIYDIDQEYLEFYRAPYEKLDLFFDKVVKLKNSVIVFEEAALFFEHGRADTDLKELIITARRRQNIIVFNFHQLRQIPIYILAYSNFLFIKKTVSDSVKRFKEMEMFDVIEKYEKVKRSDNYYETEIINLRPRVS